MIFILAECSKCKEKEGPWIWYKKRWLCEDCYEKEKKCKMKNTEKKTKN